MAAVGAWALRRKGPQSERDGLRSFNRACLLPLVVVPVLFVCAVAALVLLPASDSWYGLPGLVHGWSAATNSSGTRISICPRQTICSEGGAQVALLAVARLSGYTLYVALGLAMLSKCYCLVHWLRNTMLSELLPMQWVHELHSFCGRLFLWGALVHTAAHLVRWALRGGEREIRRMLLHHTGPYSALRRRATRLPPP